MRGTRIAVLVLVLGLILVACGGGAATTTTTAAAGATTTTAAATTTTADTGGQTVSLDDVPQECIDAFVTYMQALEPFLAGFDPAKATMADFEEMSAELEPATVAYTEATANSGCDDLELDATDEETFQLIVEIAQREAPGTVAYWEWIRDIAGTTTATTAASGDCETDIDAFMAIVDKGGTMKDFTMAELTDFGTLMTAITTECSVERTTELFDDPAVKAFLEG